MSFEQCRLCRHKLSRGGGPWTACILCKLHTGDIYYIYYCDLLKYVECSLLPIRIMMIIKIILIIIYTSLNSDELSIQTTLQ